MVAGLRSVDFWPRSGPEGRNGEKEGEREVSRGAVRSQKSTDRGAPTTKSIGATSPAQLGNKKEEKEEKKKKGKKTI